MKSPLNGDGIIPKTRGIFFPIIEKEDSFVEDKNIIDKKNWLNAPSKLWMGLLPSERQE